MKGGLVSIVVLCVLVLTACTPLENQLTGNVVINNSTAIVSINDTNITVQEILEVINESNFTTTCESYTDYVAFTQNGERTLLVDGCIGDALVSYTCEDDAYMFEEIICDYGCSNGACKEQESYTLTCVFENELGESIVGTCEYEDDACIGEGSCEIEITAQPTELVRVFDGCDNDVFIDSSDDRILFVCDEYKSSGGPSNRNSPPENTADLTSPYMCSPARNNAYQEIVDNFTLIDPQNKSQVVSSHGDMCSSNTTLTEYTCSNGVASSQQIVCDFGCTLGACKTPGVCTETDRGADSTTNGTMYQNISGIAVFNRYDTCINTTLLEEFYCEDGTPQVAYINCAGGCFNGACALAVIDGGDNVNALSFGK